jgi:ATP-binding protein involved in chromosome partitioning
VLGLIEIMSSFVCPSCGHETHPFGHGGVEAEARRLGVPFLGALPLDLATRLSGDEGRPVAAGGGAAEPWLRLARRLVGGGMA